MPLGDDAAARVHARSRPAPRARGGTESPPVSDRQSAQASSGAGPPSRARALYGQTLPVASERLAATLGALLRAERLAAGYSFRRLARAIPCAPSTVWRLEVGQHWPRPSLLRSIAAVLHVDGDPRPLALQLIAAAGDDLRPDSDRTERWRMRRAHDAIVAGHRPLPTELERRLGQHRAASAARSRAMALLGRHGALNDPELLAEAQALLEQARQLREQAGPPITVLVGRHQITAGWW